MYKKLQILLLAAFVFACLHATANAQHKGISSLAGVTDFETAITKIEQAEPLFKPRVLRRIEQFRQSSNLIRLTNNDPLLMEAVFQINFGGSGDDAEFVNFLRNTYAWNNFRIAEIIGQVSFFTEEWENSDRTLYGYDGSEMSELTYFSWLDEIGWFEELTQEFIYSEIQGQRLITEVLLKEDGATVMRFEVIYEGTDITEIREFMNTGIDLVMVGLSEFTYDGIDLIETYSFTDGETFTEPEYRTIYLNTSPANFYELIMNEMEFLPLNSSTITLLQLDLPGMIEQLWDGSDWVNDYRMIRIDADSPTPDYHFAIIYDSSFFMEGEGWQPESRFEIGFNELGQVLYGTASEYDFFDEMWVPFESEIFVYNSSQLVPDLVLFTMYDEWEDETMEVGRLLLNWDLSNVNIRDNAPQLPAGIALGNSYPNPFNPGTNIPFEIRESGQVNLQVYDMLGRRVATLINETMSAGSHLAYFDASALASGIYIVRLQSANEILTRQISLVK